MAGRKKSYRPDIPADFGEFTRVSAELGRNPNWIQGGGGNSSIKDRGVLWVKASGCWLDAAEETRIFVPLDCATLRAGLARGEDSAAAARINDPATAELRPSVEAGLHAALEARVVLHAHALEATAAAIVHPAAAIVARLGTAGITARVLPYLRPGLPLSLALRDSAVADAYLLTNHGLVVAGETAADALAMLAQVEALLAMPARGNAGADGGGDGDGDGDGGANGGGDEADIAPAAPPIPGYAPAKVATRIARDPASAAIAAGGLLVPDQLVYLGGPACVLDGAAPQAALEEHRRRFGRSPLLVLAGAHGYLAEDAPRAACITLEWLAALLGRIPDPARASYISAEETAFLCGWEAEAYRAAAARGRPPPA